MAIALGSNVGDRQRHLEGAIRALSTTLTNLRQSSFHDTNPIGTPPQPRFLNGAVVGTTSLSARALLSHLLTIERTFGRERPYPGAPRTLDLDLILFGDVVIDEPDLLVPHPRFRKRPFVLEPLAEIAGDWIDPVTGRTVRELWSLVSGLKTTD